MSKTYKWFHRVNGLMNDSCLIESDRVCLTASGMISLDDGDHVYRVACRLPGVLYLHIFLVSFRPVYYGVFPPWWGWGIKGSGDGEVNQRGEKKKKRKFGENITFDSTKS